MKPTFRLLQHACRITLFTRPNCSLCDDAKSVLSRLWDKRPFEYQEIEILKPGAEKWKAVYEFDTPVMHIMKAEGTVAETPVNAAQKLMHRFKEAEVEKVMDVVEAQ
ncbi:glutaredoxin 2 [Pseudovirgaria hyperparasitica]|uniref:Glutaredoxin-like protein n=1 Tax=Pseudovirgaria hyperparasitica TaxID=470096 RepID=A0A6A6WH35_9PEZI|nr:glutaredoxin 2 [Pseudovirgaria hyperparasitica]KAF2761529.1 glutaredoxin 2 [Pseudovirgaria hyperparasitica]